MRISLRILKQRKCRSPRMKADRQVRHHNMQKKFEGRVDMALPSFHERTALDNRYQIIYNTEKDTRQMQMK